MMDLWIATELAMVVGLLVYIAWTVPRIANK